VAGIGIRTEAIYAIAERENIAVDFAELPCDWLGVYVHLWDMQRPYIGISRKLIGDERRERCVLAHELGHHFTTSGWVVAASSPSAGYHVCRAERIANDWAVDLLVPGDQFLEQVHRGRTMDELAELFFVVPEFIQYRAAKIYRNGLRCPEIRNLCRKVSE